MSKIIALSGKKQAGKNTVANQIIGTELTSLGIVRGQATMGDNGQIWITDLFGDNKFEGYFDIQRQNEAMIRFRAENIDPYIKLYSFADCLKKNVCMDILGLTYEQCYGTDEQKNAPTHLLWENMPEVDHETGPMTAREVMQYVGTEIFRKMYGNVWVDSTIRRIKQDNPRIAIICDCRFPNEVTGVQEAGGKVLRLTRDIYAGKDQHDSETALDPDKFDWTKFDAIVDNSEIGVTEQCGVIHPILQEWGIIYEEN